MRKIELFLILEYYSNTYNMSLSILKLKLNLGNSYVFQHNKQVVLEQRRGFKIQSIPIRHIMRKL